MERSPLKAWGHRGTPLQQPCWSHLPGPSLFWRFKSLPCSTNPWLRRTTPSVYTDYTDIKSRSDLISQIRVVSKSSLSSGGSLGPWPPRFLAWLDPASQQHREVSDMVMIECRHSHGRFYQTENREESEGLYFPASQRTIRLRLFVIQSVHSPTSLLWLFPLRNVYFRSWDHHSACIPCSREQTLKVPAGSYSSTPHITILGFLSGLPFFVGH